MHRLIGAVIEKRKEVLVFFPVNEDEYLPICEAHTIYDFIRGFIRNAKDEKGEIELYHGLKLLCRTYANVRELLIERFNENYVHDNEVQEIIKKVLQK